MRFCRTVLGLLVAVGLSGFGVPGAAFMVNAALAQEQTQFIPVLAYRTGAYGFHGSAIIGGEEDYWTLLNERDGGIGGIRLRWEECEFAYDPVRGVECYERLTGAGDASFINPLSTDLTYLLIDRATAAEIPLITIGYGRTDASDGRIFPYVFPMLTNYWSQNTAKIRFIGQREGGMAQLRGKKIANVHHDSSYGRETIPVLDVQAEIYGFTVKHYAVASPGLDQSATWQDIARRFRADWVILRGWGVMNPTAIREAARVNFPRTRMVGVWWAGSEEDTLPAGAAAKGYIAAGFHPAGQDWPLFDEIRELVYGRGKGNLSITRIGSVLYNRGVVMGLISAEAIRTAQAKFGARTLTGAEIRWGMENLDMTPERIAQLGATGFVPPFSISCRDHEGGGAVKFQQWDGRAWQVISDWIETDQSIVRPMIEAAAAKFAAENDITPRSGQSLGSDCP